MGTCLGKDRQNGEAFAADEPKIRVPGATTEPGSGGLQKRHQTAEDQTEGRGETAVQSHPQFRRAPHQGRQGPGVVV